MDDRAIDIHALDCTDLIAREGWDCARCGHRHAGRTLANICIGCLCQATAPQVEQASEAGSEGAPSDAPAEDV